MDVVRITFIYPPGCSNESEVSDIMLQTFKLCKSNIANVNWLEESKIPDTDFAKTDYVIFQEFKGKHFEKLQESKCVRILGPWCVSICLMEGKSIPNFPWPIYNVAMMNCIVSCSYMPKDKKLAVKKKVHMMGGAYKEDLLSTSTHLITDTVKSEKYMAAAEAGVRLMLPTWVDAVWEASQDKNVHANDDTFKNYRCLPFHKLTISSTGISNKTKREELSRTIMSNGGTFTASLALSKTDVLVCYGDTCTSSQKFKAAKNTESIECVTPEWVTDSIAKGYALPYTSYTIKRCTSTPSKEDMIGPNFSMMSAIVPSNDTQRSTVNETIAATMTMNMSYRSTPVKRKSSDMDNYNAILDELDNKRVKLAGQCLDGCSVYLTGFDGESKDKISKYLVMSGATKYDSISDRLTHIIVGDASCPEVKFIKSKSYPVSLVSVRWLVDSIGKGRALDEEAYLVNLMDPEKDPCSSPLSQKGISLLKNKIIAENVLEEADATKTVSGPAENSIMKQYQIPENETDSLAQLLKEAHNEINYPTQSEGRAETLTLQHTENDESSQVQVFRGHTFRLVDCDEDIRSSIEDAAGTVISRSHPCQPDYEVYQVVVKSEIPNDSKGTIVVNMIWVLESIQEGEIQPLKYYHRPCVVKDMQPLQDCVVTISSYTSYERTFLKHLIEAIGGVHQEQFSRITSVQKNVQGSTHLVSLEASGKKYLAALKWKLPVVNKDWLLECARNGELVPEADFLVGKSENTFKNVTARTLGRTTTSVSEDTTSDALLTKVDVFSTKHNASVSKVDQSHPKVSESIPKVSMSLSKVNGSISESIVPERVSHLNDTGTDINNTTPIMFRNPIATPSVPYKEFSTPVQHNKNQLDSDKIHFRSPCSQVTPVNKIMQEVRNNNLLCSTQIAGTPETPPFRKSWMNMPTPKTPVGAFVRPNPSPQFRKEIAGYLNTFPDFIAPKDRRNSTPISEFKRRIWSSWESQDNQETALNDENQPRTSTNNFETIDKNVENIEEKNDNILEINAKVPSQNTFVNANLKQLEDMLRDTDKSRRSVGNFQSPITMQGNAVTKESEPLTVGWDYTERDSETYEPKKRVFMISGVADNQLRQSMVNDLKSLGSEVLEAQSYNSACTHLICIKPQRNEKTLACMSAGAWILHVSYVEKSVKAGHFLDEEEFEFGNPKAKRNINISFDKDTKQRAESMHWWRKEITKRGYGAFNDMRAIVVANKRELINRVIEAGGGVVINIEPPFEDDVHATHCLIEPRSVSNDYSPYFPLAQQGIYCVNTLYISEYLHRISKDIRESILPQFEKYYIRRD